ncbi:MAG: hypothetical protein WCY45_04420 [Acholeplasmataceae bacterium]|jgi:hypothetical protein
MLIKIYQDLDLNEEKIRELMQYYGGQVNKGLRDTLNDVIINASKA